MLTRGRSVAEFERETVLLKLTVQIVWHEMSLYNNFESDPLFNGSQYN